MSHAALKVLTISMRHLLPMNEFDRAILSFFPPDPFDAPLSLPPPQAARAVASTTATPATRTQRPLLRTPAPLPCTGAVREPGHGAAPGSAAGRSSDLS